MGNLKNIERPETSLFSFVVKNDKLKLVSDEMTNYTLEVAISSPAPKFRAVADVGVQSVETLFYKRGLFSSATQRPNWLENSSRPLRTLSDLFEFSPYGETITG